MRDFVRTHEFIILVVMAAYIVLVSAVNAQGFLTFGNLFDILKSASIYGILSLGVLLVIITGGVDVSFPAIGAFSTYLTVILVMALGWNSLPAIYAIAIVMGAVLGTLNGLLVNRLRAPALIVTLGTSGMLYGFLLFVCGSTVLFMVPSEMRRFSSLWLAVVTDPALGRTGLHPAVFIWLGLAALVALMLRHTMLGRSIYALGGNRDIFERTGASILKVEVSVFALVGAFAAIAGVTFSSVFRMVTPVAFQGEELDVIAAVVLGGAAITGGRGTVLGTVLGVLLVTLMKNSLILLGIPSAWQKALIGVLLVVGVSGPVIRRKLAERGAVGRIAS